MTIGQLLFKYRSYTPIPFIIPLLLYARPTLFTIILGGSFVIIGEVIRFWGVMYAGSETRTTDKVGASNLVTQGPFAYIRNPLYLGNILMYFGISVMANSLFPFLIIASLIYFPLQYYFIIKEEEKFLLSKFGDKYKQYCDSVKRFLPGKPYPPEKRSNIKADIKGAYYSEKRTFQAVFISVVMIVIIYFLINQ